MMGVHLARPGSGLMQGRTAGATPRALSGHLLYTPSSTTQNTPLTTGVLVPTVHLHTPEHHHVPGTRHMLTPLSLTANPCGSMQLAYFTDENTATHRS